MADTTNRYSTGKPQAAKQAGKPLKPLPQLKSTKYVTLKCNGNLGARRHGIEFKRRTSEIPIRNETADALEKTYLDRARFSGWRIRRLGDLKFDAMCNNCAKPGRQPSASSRRSVNVNEQWTIFDALKQV